jgi:DnaJ-class molecular chaperone
VKTCPDCNGDGVIEKGTDDEQQCPTCGGSGFVSDDAEDEEVTRTTKWTTDVRFTPCAFNRSVQHCL